MRPEDELGLLSNLPHSAGVIIARADCTLLSQDVNCKHLQTTRQPWQSSNTACEIRTSKTSSIRLADVLLQQLYSSKIGMRCSKPFLPQHVPANQSCPFSAWFCQTESCCLAKAMSTILNAQCMESPAEDADLALMAK